MRNVDRNDPKQVEREIDEAISQIESALHGVFKKGDLLHTLSAHIEDVVPDRIARRYDQFYTWMVTHPQNAHYAQKRILEEVIREWVIENLADVQMLYSIGPYAEDAA